MKNSDDVNCEGGPAFPVSIPGCGDNGWQGMTLRDWFAGQTLVGLCMSEMGDDQFMVEPSLLARCAYSMADAMLAERSKP